MIAETDRILIRKLLPQDEEFFVRMAKDGSLKRDIGFDENCQGWMKKWIANARKMTLKNDPTVEYLAYAVELKESPVVIGSVGCSWFSDLKKVGITYFIGADYRGMGYATEAVKEYVDYFFRNYQMSELMANIRIDNVQSQRVVEKCGFRFIEKRMYKDVNDDLEEMYLFYRYDNEKNRLE